MSDEEVLSAARIDEMANEAAVLSVISPIVLANKTLMLTSPQKLWAVANKSTVLGYVPHIGGETFKIFRAYISGKKKIIICLNPTDAAPYEWVEMPMDEARACLGGLEPLLNSDEINLPKRIEIERMKIVDRENKKLEKLREDSYDDYGSW